MLAGEPAATRDRALAAALATPAQVLAAVAAGHELGVAYGDGPLAAGEGITAAPGVLPGQRIPDAGPLVRADGSTTSLRELLRAPEPQLWLCAGAGDPGRAVALAQRLAAPIPVRILVIADRPPPAPEGLEMLADPTLRVHGRLGAASDAAYVVRPDGHLAFRCEPPDADWLRARLESIGVRAAAARA